METPSKKIFNEVPRMARYIKAGNSPHIHGNELSSFRVHLNHIIICQAKIFRCLTGRYFFPIKEENKVFSLPIGMLTINLEKLFKLVILATNKILV
jgi:hypothetical protein